MVSDHEEVTALHPIAEWVADHIPPDNDFIVLLIADSGCSVASSLTTESVLAILKDYIAVLDAAAQSASDPPDR
jgi:hypothetical protein